MHRPDGGFYGGLRGDFCLRGHGFDGMFCSACGNCSCINFLRQVNDVEL